MTIEKKLENLQKMHSDAWDAHKASVLKNQLLDDAMKDFMTTDLGFPKDQKEVSLPEILAMTIKASKK